MNHARPGAPTESGSTGGSAAEPPIAIIGIGRRFPGGVDSADAPWARVPGDGTGRRLLATEWDEAPHPGPPAPAAGEWLMLVEKDDRMADALAGALGAALLAAPLSVSDTGAQVLRRHLTAGHRGVVMLCPDPVGVPGAGGIDRARDQVRRLADLVHALVATGDPPRLYVITRGACAVRGAVPSLEQAPLGAVCRVAAAEHPELRITHVDAEVGDPATDLAAELLADTAEARVAWRSGKRYTARLRRVPLGDGEQVPGVREDGAYVVTGGVGALGLRLTRHLAEHGAGRVVVGDRAALTGRAAGAIAALCRAGADIQVVHGDITDPATASLLVSAATGTGLPLRGVAHAAGITAKAGLAQLGDDLLDRVWAPRTAGAWHLLRAVGGRSVDWWLSFSSAASPAGSPGQGACAAADGWLDAFTAYCRARGVPAYGVNWEAWAPGYSSGES